MPLLRWFEVKIRRAAVPPNQVPVEVRPSRRKRPGMRWLVDAAPVKRGEKSMPCVWLVKLVDASEG